MISSSNRRRGVFIQLTSQICVSWEISNTLDSITTAYGRVQMSVSDVTLRVGAAKPTHRGCV